MVDDGVDTSGAAGAAPGAADDGVDTSGAAAAAGAAIERPHVTFPDPAVVAEVAAVEAVLPAAGVVFSWARSFVFAVVFALAGSVVYALIAKATEAQWGIVSIVIGILAGIGAARGGRGRKAQIVGAVAAALGYFAGQMIAVALIVGWDVFSLMTVAMFGELLVMIGHATFTTMDALFLGIAVYQGWVIPRARDA